MYRPRYLPGYLNLRNIYPLTIPHDDEEKPLLNLFPYRRFHFCNKGPNFEKDGSVAERLARLEAKYQEDGMRTTVEGILLVNRNNTIAHLLLLQDGASYKLPGGCLRPGEKAAIEGLKRKLTGKLGCILPRHQHDWQIGECVATWWRLDFDREPVLDPEIPDPKECKKIFIVHLTEGMHIAKPENLKLVFVPLFFINDHPELFGPVISEIPRQLSQTLFQVHLCHRHYPLTLGL